MEDEMNCRAELTDGVLVLENAIIRREYAWSCASLSWISCLMVSICDARNVDARPTVAKRVSTPQSIKASATPLAILAASQFQSGFQVSNFNQFIKMHSSCANLNFRISDK